MNLRGRNKIALFAFAMSPASYQWHTNEIEIISLKDITEVDDFKQPANPKDKIHVKPFYQKGRW
jgi:hypothetical protein